MARALICLITAAAACLPGAAGFLVPSSAKKAAVTQPHGTRTRATTVSMGLPLTYTRINDDIHIVGAVELDQINKLMPRVNSWLYLAQDSFPDMGLGAWGFSATLGSRPGFSAAHVPIDPKAVTLEGAVQALRALDNMPKPAMISCASSFRAGAVATMYLAVKNNMTPEQALEMASSRGLGFTKCPVLVEWVTGTVAAARTPTATHKHENAMAL